jgi:hypothetical protein
MGWASRLRGVRKRPRAQPARATLHQLADANSEQITDLQAHDRGYCADRNGPWRPGKRNAKTHGDANRNQDGRNEDKYSEALAKGRANQKSENGEQHPGRTP